MICISNANVTQNSKPTHVRYRILAFLFISVVINYMDRANISVAATSLSKEFNLSSVQLGLIFSAFGWTYVAFQIPGGLLTDRFGPRLLYTFSLVGWSLVTLLQGFTNGFVMLFVLRLATGALEAPAYPINNRVVTGWFPDHERASAIAVYTSGQYIGLAFLTPVMATIQYYLEWKGLFIITGSAGIIWGLIWYLFYRDPSKHKQVNLAELDHIEKGGGIINYRAEKPNIDKSKFTWANLREVFSHRKLWGIYLGQYAITSTLWFFLTWFPVYLVKYRGLGFIRTGFLASVPFLAAFAGIILSGFLSDFLVKKKVSADVARKAPVITGLLLSVAIVGANYVNSPALIILFMAIAFFGNGMASITWVFVSLLAPKHLIGVTGGAFNFIGNLSSVSVPFIIGFLVRNGNFEPALIFISAMAIVGICCYAFLVGKIERVKSLQQSI
jgi:ACS family D-galactonate transporter-like MFS transporter